LTHLPARKAKKKDPNDCADRVLKIGDQLDGQQRKGALMRLTQKSGDGDLFFPESWKQVNGISPVGVNFLITMAIPTDGTFGANIRQKIDWIRKEGFFVFPNRLELVMVGELNFSAALPTGRQGLGLPQTV